MLTLQYKKDNDQTIWQECKFGNNNFETEIKQNRKWRTNWEYTMKMWRIWICNKSHWKTNNNKIKMTTLFSKTQNRTKESEEKIGWINAHVMSAIYFDDTYPSALHLVADVFMVRHVIVCRRPPPPPPPRNFFVLLLHDSRGTGRQRVTYSRKVKFDNKAYILCKLDSPVCSSRMNQIMNATLKHGWIWNKATSNKNAPTFGWCLNCFMDRPLLFKLYVIRWLGTIWPSVKTEQFLIIFSSLRLFF